MQHRLARWLVTAAVLGLLALSVPAVASATVSGGCTATGTSSSGSIDITSEPVWHLKSTDSAGGSGTAPVPMTSASVSAYALGIAIPIPGASGTGKGDTTGSVDSLSLSTFKVLGRIYVVAGHATGDGGSCDGQILIVLDDVDALFTLLGGGGLALAILMLGAILFAGRSGGCLSKVLCAVFGGLGAIGLGLSLEQFEVISPTSPVGLVIVLAGSVLGFLLATRLGMQGTPPPATTAPVTPPPPPPTTPPTSSGPTPGDVGRGAADMLGDAAGNSPPDMVGGGVVGGVGSAGAFDDATHTADDIVGGGEPPGPPPEDPNAPGVDVRE